MSGESGVLACIMEDLIGACRQSVACFFGSALALGSGAEPNLPGGPRSLGTQWGVRKEEEEGS